MTTPTLREAAKELLAACEVVDSTLSPFARELYDKAKLELRAALAREPEPRKCVECGQIPDGEFSSANPALTICRECWVGEPEPPRLPRKWAGALQAVEAMLESAERAGVERGAASRDEPRPHYPNTAWGNDALDAEQPPVAEPSAGPWRTVWHCTTCREFFGGGAMHICAPRGRIVECDEVGEWRVARSTTPKEGL